MLLLSANNQLDQMTANIRYFASLATHEETMQGLSWYGEAHQICIDIASQTRFTVKQAAAFLAILSPRQSWSRNVELAIYFATTEETVKSNGKALHTKQVIRKLQAIANGAPIETTIQKSYGKVGKSGKLLKSSVAIKTLNFYFNIANYGENGNVTIDAHAAGAALNVFSSYDERGILAIRNYDLMSRAYQLVADEKGINSHQLQAIVWLAYRTALDSYRKAQS